jgi:glycosyltransferase involved in cell wall biosynthesis
VDSRGIAVRIAMVHSFYSSAQPSGENAVVMNEVDALRRAGCEVALFSAHTDDLEGELFYRLRSGLRVATGYGHNPLEALNSYSPDVVHIHNLFPNFGRRWVEQIAEPIVHTMHNFRSVCANGLLYRAGATCTMCPDGAPWSSLRYACYRGSRAATLPLSLALKRGPSADPLYRRADQLIALTELQRQVLERSGFEDGPLVVAPNFLPAGLDSGVEISGARHGWLVVARLTEEKGVVELLDEWPANLPLRVVGDGPLRHEVAARAQREIEFLGPRPREAVLDLMRRSWGVIFPSRGFETFGLVYLEALATGTATAAFTGNTVAEMVTQDGTGKVLDWSDHLQLELGSDAIDEFGKLNEYCRQVFEARYSERAFVESRQRLYAALIDARQ